MSTGGKAILRAELHAVFAPPGRFGSSEMQIQELTTRIADK